MKKTILYIGFCLLGLCLLTAGLPTAQAQNTAAEKSAKTKMNRNFSKKSSNPANFLSRGGHGNYPCGLSDNKNINMGFQLGGSLALMDALKEERCSMGANLDLYMHGILNNTNTIALGCEIKAFYLLTNADKYMNLVTPGSREDAEEPQVSVGSWIAGTVQFSMLANFNATARCNIQLKLNVGPLVVMVPENHVTFQTMEIQMDNSIAATTTEFRYKPGMSIGGSATVGADLLYALSSHCELKTGVDWTYMRFFYDKEYTQPQPKVIKELRQFGIYNIHIGFAFSF